MLNNGVIVSGGSICQLTASVVQAALELGLVEQHLGRVRQELFKRCEALCSALKESCPELDFYKPVSA